MTVSTVSAGLGHLQAAGNKVHVVCKGMNSIPCTFIAAAADCCKVIPVLAGNVSVCMCALPRMAACNMRVQVIHTWAY